MKIPRTGIEIWDGLPGSGKTYSGVDEAIRVILEERRPVYTNMPLRTRVLRRYLQIRADSPERSNYLIPLKQEHLLRFIDRNQRRADFLEEHRGKGISESHLARMFLEENGPDVCEDRSDYGPRLPNWLYPGSVIILDEFHRWADQRKQKKEHPGYLTWATMHRHHMHRIIILTQDKMQVSLSFRRNASKLYHFADKRHIPVFFGLKLPLFAFARDEFAAELLEGKTTAESKPIETTVKFPSIGRGRVIYRCYDSFSHIGGIGRLMDVLESVRQRVEGQKLEQVKVKVSPVKKWHVVASAIAGLVVGVAGTLAWPRAKPAEPVPIVAVTPTKPPPTATAVVGQRARVNGTWKGVGDEVDGWKIERVEPGLVEWRNGTAVHIARVGLRKPPAASAAKPDAGPAATPSGAAPGGAGVAGP